MHEKSSKSDIFGPPHFRGFPVSNDRFFDIFKKCTKKFDQKRAKNRTSFFRVFTAATLDLLEFTAGISESRTVKGGKMALFDPFFRLLSKIDDF